MPGARFFLLSHLRSFILPGGRGGGADYNRVRRTAVLPILPAALYSSFWIFMHYHEI